MFERSLASFELLYCSGGGQAVLGAAVLWQMFVAKLGEEERLSFGTRTD